MDLETLIAHGTSALAAGGGASFFAKMLFKGWQKRLAKAEDARERDQQERREWESGITILLTKLEERVSGLLERDKSVDHAVAIAILKERTEKHGRDINGLGTKLREVKKT